MEEIDQVHISDRFSNDVYKNLLCPAFVKMYILNKNIQNHMTLMFPYYTKTSSMTKRWIHVITENLVTKYVQQNMTAEQFQEFCSNI